MKMDKENVTVKAESTGSLLAMNLILMVLSCVLFVGTTLAWFTDQTSGGVNRIQAGNLEAVLVIGEGRTTTSVPLDPPSGAQLVSAGTAVQLQLHKLNVTESTEDENTNSTEETDVWNPGDIFISDVMQVVKASGSVPFDYKLELQIDPPPRTSATVPSTEESEGATDDSSAAPELKARTYIDFRIVDVSTISTVSDGTRTYKYADIAAYFGSAGGDGEGSARGGTIEPSKTPHTPIWTLPSTDGNEEDLANEFSSEDEQLSFVIIAKIKDDFVKLSADAESDTIRNPFELIVTLKQLKAEHFEPAAEAGDVS